MSREKKDWMKSPVYNDPESEPETPENADAMHREAMEQANTYRDDRVFGEFADDEDDLPDGEFADAE